MEEGKLMENMELWANVLNNHLEALAVSMRLHMERLVSGSSPVVGSSRKTTCEPK